MLCNKPFPVWAQSFTPSIDQETLVRMSAAKAGWWNEWLMLVIMSKVHIYDCEGINITLFNIIRKSCCYYCILFLTWLIDPKAFFWSYSIIKRPEEYLVLWSCNLCETYFRFFLYQWCWMSNYSIYKLPKCSSSLSIRILTLKWMIQFDPLQSYGGATVTDPPVKLSLGFCKQFSSHWCDWPAWWKRPGTC